ncbi:MAG: tetratricopeptide repeat protein [Bacteroidota bacterium]
MSPKHLGIALVGLSVIAAVWLLSRPDSTPAPPPPAFPVSPASSFVNAADAEAYYVDLVRERPSDAQARIALAQLLLQRARETGEAAAYLPRVDELLSEALATDPANKTARVLSASLANKRHDFEQGRDIARALISEDPNYSHAYGLLIDALIELGEYEEASDVADQFSEVKPGYSLYARVAYLRELMGNGDGAIEAMRMALDAAQAGTMDRAWAAGQLGMLYLNEGKVDTAAFIFERLLEEAPSYGHARAGLSRVASVRGERARAIAWAERAILDAPNDMGLQETLALAYAEAGDDARADSVGQIVFGLMLDEERAGTNIDMEWADVMADQGQQVGEALERAEREYARRPKHRHVLETYAWSLHAAGRSAEAIPYAEQALARLPSADGKLNFRAAHIYAGAGRTDEAARQFALALENDVHIEDATLAAQASAER